MAAGLINRFSSRVTAAPLGTSSRCSEDPLYGRPFKQNEGDSAGGHGSSRAIDAAAI